MTQLSELEQQKQQRLSQKRIWISTLLGLLIPITPYLYTQRWKPLLWVLGIGTGFLMVAEVVSPTKNMEESFEQGQRWSPIMMLVAITDNWLAIARSREQLQGENDPDSES